MSLKFYVMKKAMLVIMIIFTFQLSIDARDFFKHKFADSLNILVVKKITVHDDVTLILVCDPGKALMSDAAAQKYLRFEIKDGELIIHKKQAFLSNRRIVCFLPVKDLQNLTVVDNANVISNEVINCTKEMNILIKGDGLIDLSLNAEKIKIVSKGRARVKITGNFSSCKTQWDDYGVLVIEYFK
jgi:hypothetical protein